MARDTLLDFFDDFASLDRQFVVHDDGYRTRTFTYRQVAGAARGFAAKLRAESIGKGDKVLFWSENRPEWLAALWGCLLQGAVAVPIDYRASPEMLTRVHRIVDARLLLAGEEVAVPGAFPAPVWRLSQIDWSSAGAIERAGIAAADLAEIIFTSGATGDPKGVTITHRNLLANIVPVEGEVRKYRKYAKPFAPIRFLNLLPLSHLFGQSMATFIPPMLPGVVVFMHGYNPREIVRQIKMRRVSVLVSVPKILEVLREYVAQTFPEAAKEPPAKMHWLRRWLRYRRVHRTFGWKFWSFIVGAAPLDGALEEFWSRLGFVVIQGYGLTETAPIVTLNHPFHAAKGSVGKPIAGVEVKIAEDGEVLVRGENVSTGYYGENKPLFEDGWFHTGDIGAIDASGQIRLLGRKKETIVTPEGLNVYPEDVERVLNAIPGVRDSAAVGTDRVHAVVEFDAGADPAEIVRQANRKLEDHQQIRGISIWPSGELPRTEGTRKLKRGEIARWVANGEAPRVAAPQGAGDMQAILARFGIEKPVTARTALAELGLSSLERVELMMALEQRGGGVIDEGAFSRAETVGDLLAPPKAAVPTEPIRFPAWNRTAIPRLLRRIFLPTVILPLGRAFAWLHVEGREHFASVQGPVVFAANHQSFFDGPMILAAMPARWRYRTATAMSKEFFHAHFYPDRHSRTERFTNSLNYVLACLFFNTFPLPQREAGAGATLRYIGELSDDRWSILIFPEGKRTQKGEINPFQPGVGMIASRLGLPVIPVRIEGFDRVLHQSARFATPGRATVKFGAPMHLEGDDYAALAAQVEAAVRAL